MRIVWMIIKYLLWSLFSIIVFLLLVGLVKMKGDIKEYIDFLDTHDWSVFHRSQPVTRLDSFRPISLVEPTFDDILGSEDNSIVSGDSNVLWEGELDGFLDERTVDEYEEDFGFVSDESHNSAPTNDSTIQQLIEQRK